MVNRSQFGTDIVGTADLIYLYYLFGESYFRSQADSRLVKDVIRQPSWASALLSVVQKSSSLLSDKRRKNRPPNSANLSGITSEYTLRVLISYLLRSPDIIRFIACTIIIAIFYTF